MKLVGDASHFPKSQHKHQYTLGRLVDHAFTQVEAFITGEGTNLANVLALIMVLEMAFREPGAVAIGERKLEVLM
jgi:hypothetical protein